MSNIMSRFKVLDAPRARPGHCFVCRGTQNGPFIDTKLSVPFEGAIIICRGCITEMYTQLDLSIVINEEEVAARVEIAHNNGKIVGEQIALEALNEFVAQYQSPGLDALLNSTAVAPIVEVAEEQSADDAKPQRKPREKSSPSDASDLEESGPAGEPGRTDISGDSGNGSESSLSDLSGINF